MKNYDRLAAKTQLRKQCTHCGDMAFCTDDHVFPSQLNVDRPYPHAAKRALKVPSCSKNTCNGRSDEILLQDFLAAAYDFSFVDKRLPHLASPAGRQDLLNILTCSVRDISSLQNWEDVKTGHIDGRLTNIFKKMFMGIRRALLGKFWTFLGPEHFYLFWIQEYQDGGVLWPLPEVVGGKNPCLRVPPDWQGRYVTNRQYREFHYGKGDEDLYFLRYAACDNPAVPPLLLVCLAKDLSKGNDRGFSLQGWDGPNPAAVVVDGF